MARAYLKFADAVFLGAKWLTIAIMAAMTACVLVGVFFRYVVPLPMAWPPEVARFLMVAVTMFGSAVAIRQVEHVGITFVVDALPLRLRTMLYMVGVGVTAVFLAVFVVFATRMTLEMGPRQYSSSIGMPLTFAYAAMPIGGATMLVQLGAALLEALERAKIGKSPFGPDRSQEAS